MIMYYFYKSKMSRWKYAKSKICGLSDFFGIDYGEGGCIAVDAASFYIRVWGGNQFFIRNDLEVPFSYRRTTM